MKHHHRQINFFKGSVFFLSGILIGASVFLLTQASYTVQTNIDNAVQVIKSIVLQQSDGITTGSVLSGDTINTVHMQATHYCDEAGANCVDIEDVYTGTVSAGGESLWNTGTSDSINYMSGNVGIGTDSPSTTLDVDGTTMLRDQVYADAIKASSSIGNDLLLQGGNGVTGWPSHTGGDVILRGGTGGPVSGNIILAPGTEKVGIGTNSPSTTLDVNGETTTNDLSVDSEIRLTNRNIAYFGSNTLHFGDREADDFGVKLYENGSASIVLTGGNVGIGTDTPNHKLQVSGDIVPETNGISNLGTNHLRWDIYGGEASINSIDTKIITGADIVATQGFVIPVKFSAPATAPVGSMYFNPSSATLYIFNGSSWRTLVAGP